MISDIINLASLSRKKKCLGINDNNYGTPIIKLHEIRIPELDFEEKYEWCQDFCGDKWIWSASPFIRSVLFLHKEDALQFKLTFGSYQ